MAAIRKISEISEATSNSRRAFVSGNLVAIGVVAASSMTIESALACPPDGEAPAPKIGNGVLGVILSIAAVKYFRRPP